MKNRSFILFLILITLVIIFCACNKTDMETNTDKGFSQSNGTINLSNGTCYFKFDLNSGYFSFNCNDLYVKNALSKATDIDGNEYVLKDNLTYKTSNVNNDLGKGVRLTVTKEGSVSFNTEFTVYNDKKGATIRCFLSSDSQIASNWLCPVFLCEENESLLKVGNDEETYFVQMPYDNDNYNRYASKTALSAVTKTYFSSEVTAVYDADTKNSLVVGSLEHNDFKSGIELVTNKTQINNFKVYAGAANEVTRDESGQKHGYVYGTTVSSPTYFMGFFTSYVEGLDTFADYSSVITPPLKWEGDTVIGWNSWGALANYVNYEEYVATADFYNEELDLSDKTVFINLDSFWGDNIPPEKIRQAVEHIHSMGMKTGAYCTPYVLWWDAFDWDVPGTDGKYKYKDILLKDENGEYLKIKSSYLSLDPTHPGTIQNIQYQLQAMLDYGFDYVKMDFMSNGAIEAEHYEKSITTGTQAYNYGMSRIRDFLSKERIGKDFFISLSIAPLFPSQYAHARRLSCDAFSSIDSTEYMLNSLTYGWWQNGKIYAYTDPDHCVLYKPFNNDASTQSEAVARFNSVIISGTVLLGSDKLYNKDEQTGRLIPIDEAVKRTKDLYNNEELLSVAFRHQAFKPYTFISGKQATNIFYSVDDEYLYVALFNYHENVKKTLKADLSEFLQNKTYAAVNLNTKEELSVTDNFKITLEPKSSCIIKIKI